MKVADLRPYLPADAIALAALFQASIEDLTEEDYDANQRAAWAGAADAADFGQRLAEALTLVATRDGTPVGFVALAKKTHIDMLYVDPGAARQGVASMLYDAIEKLAGARGAKLLTADVSDTARPFFDVKGFTARHRMTVTCGDEWLGNTRMEKTLG